MKLSYCALKKLEQMEWNGASRKLPDGPPVFFGEPSTDYLGKERPAMGPPTLPPGPQGTVGTWYLVGCTSMAGKRILGKH